MPTKKSIYLSNLILTKNTKIAMRLQELLKAKIYKKGGVDELLKFLDTFMKQVDRDDLLVFKTIYSYYKILHLVDVDVTYHMREYKDNVEKTIAIVQKYYEKTNEQQLYNILSYLDYCKMQAGTKVELRSTSTFFSIRR